MRTSPPGWLLYLRIHQLSTGLTTRPVWPRQPWWMTLRKTKLDKKKYSYWPHQPVEKL
ncbi:hypothetical protein AAY473_013627 [Plecturocebus cupreus]